MDDVRDAWVPLGTLLLRVGAISPEQLELALIEKERSPRRLGEILVEWGWVSSTEVAQALAELELDAAAGRRPVEMDQPAEQGTVADETRSAARAWRPDVHVIRFIGGPESARPPRESETRRSSLGGIRR